MEPPIDVFKNDSFPHKAIIKFEIKVHQIYKDGSINPIPITEAELGEAGIGRYASISVDGFNKRNCLEKIKEKLEKLNE